MRVTHEQLALLGAWHVITCPHDGCQWKEAVRRHGTCGGSSASKQQLVARLKRHLQANHPEQPDGQG